MLRLALVVRKEAQEDGVEENVQAVWSECLDLCQEGRWSAVAEGA